MLPSTVFDRWQGFHGRTLVLTMTTDEYTWIRNKERQMQPRLHAPFSSVHFDLFQQFPMEGLKLSSQHSINRWPPFTLEVIYIFCEHLKQRIFLSCRINAILVSSNLRYEDVKSTSSLFCTQLSYEGDTYDRLSRTENKVHQQRNIRLGITNFITEVLDRPVRYQELVDFRTFLCRIFWSPTQRFFIPQGL